MQEVAINPLRSKRAVLLFNVKALLPELLWPDASNNNRGVPR